MNFFNMKVNSACVGYMDMAANVTKCMINIFDCRKSQPTPGSKQ
jgi:hypothetical protein